MNKKDFLDKISEIYNKLEDLQQSAENLSDDLKSLIRKMDDLPTEPEEIEDSKEDE